MRINRIVFASIQILIYASISSSVAQQILNFKRVESKGFFVIEIPTALHVSNDLLSTIEFKSANGGTKVDVGVVEGNSAVVSFSEANAREGNLVAGYTPCASLPPKYRVNRNGVIAFSCYTANAKIVYDLEKFEPGSRLSMHIEYPSDERVYWDPAIGVMVKSLVRSRQ